LDKQINRVMWGFLKVNPTPGPAPSKGAGSKKMWGFEAHLRLKTPHPAGKIMVFEKINRL
jgi:hypothetical protein